MNVFEELRALLESDGKPSGEELERNIDPIFGLTNQSAEIHSFLQIEKRQIEPGNVAYCIECDTSPRGIGEGIWCLNRDDSRPLAVHPESKKIAAQIHRSSLFFEKWINETGAFVITESGPQIEHSRSNQESELPEDHERLRILNHSKYNAEKQKAVDYKNVPHSWAELESNKAIKYGRTATTKYAKETAQLPVKPANPCPRGKN